MDLLCLHQKAVNSLGKSSGDTHDRKVYDFLRAPRFEYVRCFQDQADGNMMSMKKVMETLNSPSGNDELLHKTQAACDEVSLDQNSENPYLRLPSKDIIDRFAEPAKVLPVSKRYCPACYALMQ
ncbi:hypothetical protein C7974DRAFT_388075 [Boeremia exigua]|uniref:uncharacterized protein n=1 Tax=Boeremia exigua TaxID=749465 RepID=UPI001E8D63FE|nr:uncharacterized protein C7974DRAFT_388075 [Boeremia exigua]KAH6639237.1 hypothetical protein C7974DRAFT_388075 [Boeremia exigua]